ncbi:pilin [Patescibacteria group bacterium]|nr:pilin [Patescibacteria group bacterium]MBU1472204.1 pilin [Patescibacteria group bacterium]MBU2459598.1 pilin [Patescibacteria group bacterium]MBU2544161.1 pilin [Patescibacteria group bacterium]
MENSLAQAIKLPGPNETPVPINYPAEYQGFSFSSVADVVNKAIPLIFGFAGLALLLVVISAGFGLMTSAGDTKKLEAGKQRLTNGILGFIVIFVAYWAVQLAGKILGLTEIQTIFK